MSTIRIVCNQSQSHEYYLDCAKFTNQSHGFYLECAFFTNQRREFYLDHLFYSALKSTHYSFLPQTTAAKIDMTLLNFVTEFSVGEICSWIRVD